jgi:hypothetical protein
VLAEQCQLPAHEAADRNPRPHCLVSPRQQTGGRLRGTVVTLRSSAPGCIQLSAPSDGAANAPQCQTMAPTSESQGRTTELA